MKKKILFVGYRGKQEHLSSGHDLYLLTDKTDYREEHESHFSKIWVVDDIFDWAEVRAILSEAQFDAVLTRFEDFIVPASAVAQEKNLPGIDFAKSVTFRNKFLMQKAFKKKNVPSADFVLISKPEEAEEFLTRHDFPLILKQLSGVHSRFVAKVKSKEHLAQTLSTFQKEILNEDASLHDQVYNHSDIPATPDPRTHFLLEELLLGEELSIDAITVNGKHYLTPVCRYLTSEELGIEDHHLPIRILPSDYTPEQEEIIFRTTKEALDALGADYCGSHTEVFFDQTNNNCRVVEVAARSGGFRGEMFSVTTQEKFNLNETCIQAACGENVSVPSDYSVYAAVIEIFSPQQGKLSSVDYSFLDSHPHVDYITINRQLGDTVGPASRGGKFIMKFLLHGQDYDKTLSEATNLLHQIRDSIELQ